MKTNIINKIMIVVLAIFTAKSFAQHTINCPYTVTNNKACSVLFNWEVQSLQCTGMPCVQCPPIGFCCPTICSGTVCLGAGQTWTLTAACCTSAAYDVVITVLKIDNTGNCSGVPSCSITPAAPCASGSNCIRAGTTPVSGTVIASCCGPTGYSAGWTASGVTIN